MAQKAAVFRYSQGSAVIAPHGIFQIQHVLDTSGFVAGVHGQLGKTNIGGGNGNVGKGNVAQSGATGEVSAVAVGLHRYIRSGTDLAENRGGYTVGAVTLVGVEFQHDTVVNNGGVGGIRIFRMVGMQGMGIVRRDHKGLT